MTEPAFKVSDYLDDAEMKQIASDTFRQHCLQMFRDDAERVFTNSAYKIVREMVDEAFDGKAMEMVTAQTKGCITKMSAHTVFGSRGIYDRDDTEGRKAINAAVHKHRERIENRVASIADSLTRDEIITAILDSEISFKLVRP